MAGAIKQFTGPRYGRGLKLTASSIVLALLSACGGEEGSSDDGIVTVPAPPPAPTPSPTPTPTPTPVATGQVASVDLGSIPAGANDLVTNFKVTNSGLYMAVNYDDETKPDAILKLRGTPAFSDAWYSTIPNNTANGSVSDYAPVNVYSESRSELTFYWAGRDFTGDGVERWGLHTVNGNGVSTVAEERSFGSYGIKLVASGARNGVVASRPWILWYQPSTVGNSGYSIYQDDGAYTKANSISDRFSTPATPPLPGDGSAIFSHPSNPELFVVSDNKLFLYGADKLIRSWTLPTGGVATDMMWSGDALYFGFAGKVYKTDGTTLRSIADVNTTGFAVEGGFCITGGEMFLPTGEAINLLSNTRRNWIKKGQLSSAQASAVQQLELAALSSRVFCSSYATGTTLYLVSPATRSVRVVTPVPR